MRPSVLSSATVPCSKTLRVSAKCESAGSVVNMLQSDLNLVEVIKILKVRNEVEKERGE